MAIKMKTVWNLKLKRGWIFMHIKDPKYPSKLHFGNTIYKEIKVFSK